MDELLFEDGEAAAGHPVVGEQLAEAHLLLEFVHKGRRVEFIIINSVNKNMRKLKCVIN